MTNFQNNDTQSEKTDICKKYLDAFSTGKEHSVLYHLLAKDFFIEAPFYYFESAKEYIETLQLSSAKFSYKLLHSFEQENKVCLVFLLSNESRTTPISQIFEFNQENKIQKSLLIFDSAPLVENVEQKN